MKIKTTTKVESEIDVKLPIFFNLNFSQTLYAVIREDLALIVREKEISWYDSHEPVSQLINSDSFVEITKEEFTKYFDAKMEELGQLRQHFFTDKTK